MSEGQHNEPLQWHWLYIPLVAYLVLCVGPSVLAPIWFVVSLFTLDVPVRGGPNPLSLLVIPVFLALIFWPFLWLHGFARDALIKEPSSEKSLRLATITSVVAMSLPGSLLSLSMASADGGGQGAGILAFLFLFVLPLLGVLGWLTAEVLHGCGLDPRCGRRQGAPATAVFPPKRPPRHVPCTCCMGGATAAGSSAGTTSVRSVGMGFDVSSKLKCLERVKGIEPSYSAWKAAALPLSYTRVRDPRVAVRRRSPNTAR